MVLSRPRMRFRVKKMAGLALEPLCHVEAAGAFD